MGDVLDFLLKLAARLIWWIIPTLDVEVLYFRYESLRSDDVFVVLSPWHDRYHARLALTNKSDRPVFIKTFSTTIDEMNTYPHADTENTIRLDSHERRVLDVVFPVSQSDKPKDAGKFEITVVPTVGRKKALSGVFPVA
jgi:hypothetical protein